MDVIGITRNTEDGVIDSKERCSALFPMLAADDEKKIFLGEDNTLGFCFLCQPLSGGSDQTQKKVAQLLNQSYPANTVMQFFLVRNPDCSRFFANMRMLRSGFRDPVLSPKVDKRVAWLQKHTVEPIRMRSIRGVACDLGLVMDLQLVVSVKIPFAGATPSEKEMLAASTWQGKVESLLRSVGAAPYAMPSTMYLRLMQVLINRSPHAAWRTDPGTTRDTGLPLNAQIADPDTSVTASRDCLRLGDSCWVKMLSAKRLPDSYYFGEAMLFAGDVFGGGQGLKENYAVCVNVLFPEAEKLKGELERRRQWVTQQAYGPILKFVPVLADKKASFDIIYESESHGERPLKMTYSVMIFAPTEKEAVAASVAAQSYWATLRFKLMEDTFFMLPMFLNCLPLGTDLAAIRSLQRYKSMTSGEAPVLLPIFGEWKGTGTPHVALISRTGQLMSMSLHDSSTNKNGVIAAESGSGKSFLLNELIVSYLSEGGRIWVIDAGKSYKKLCESLDGEFVQFDESSTICLNPFEFIKNWEDEEDGIVSLVEAMASPKGLLTDYQKSELKRAMKEQWQSLGNKMTVDTVADALIAHADVRVQDVGHQLFAFTSKGSYGRFFSGTNNANFLNRFTVLELDELQGRKHLRQVVLLQLIFTIQREMYEGARDRKKLLIIDEAWDLLKEGEISVFMEHAYRKFRKYGGSAVIATQSVNDLYGNAVGRAIAENSASMFLLGQKKESIEAVKDKKYLVLDAAGFEQLKSVYTEAGAFSEIFLHTEVGYGIGRLVVSNFQKLLFSTAPEDVYAIERKRQESGCDVVQAINQILVEKGLSPQD